MRKGDIYTLIGKDVSDSYQIFIFPKIPTLVYLLPPHGGKVTCSGKAYFEKVPGNLRKVSPLPQPYSEIYLLYNSGRCLTLRFSHSLYNANACQVIW